MTQRVGLLIGYFW